MMYKNFHILEERPVDYMPLAALRAYQVKVNRLSSLVAVFNSGGYSGQHLVALTPPNLPHDTAKQLTDGLYALIATHGLAEVIKKMAYITANSQIQASA